MDLFDGGSDRPRRSIGKDADWWDRLTAGSPLWSSEGSAAHEYVPIVVREPREYASRSEGQVKANALADAPGSACGGAPAGASAGAPDGATGAGPGEASRDRDAGCDRDGGSAPGGAPGGASDGAFGGASGGALGDVSGAGSSSWVAVAALVEAARAVALVPVPEDAGVCLAEAEELLAARDRITSALAARVGRVHRAGEAKHHGHASTKLWLRSAGGMTPAGAGRLLTMSMELPRLSEVRRLFADGGLAEGVVEAICTATAGLTDEQAATAERILLELAAAAGAAEVAKAGRYLRAVLDPDGHERDEQADFDRRFFRVRRRRGGGLEGEFYLPVEVAARLQHMLDVYAKPKAEGDDRTLSVRNADALIAFLENRIVTELLVLVNAESLPDDPPSGTPCDDGEPTIEEPTIDDGEPTNEEPAGEESEDAEPGSRSSTVSPEHDPADDPGAQQEGIDRGHHRNRARRSQQARPQQAHAPDPPPEHDVPPNAEHGSDTWPGGEPWLGGGSWAGAGPDAPPWPGGEARAESDARAGAEADVPPGVGGDAPPGVGVNCPPGVWLRGLPGLILATGHLLPASSVHRLARTSTLVRIVMNAAGQVLDMGRKVRLATPAQRRAIYARYATCWVDGCPLPATMCQIDHSDDWCSGGLTDLKLLGPACQFHNRDRYRHPTRYTRRKIGDDRWAFTYRNPRTTRTPAPPGG
ncbi:DUF222 domain-containing protein [Microbispora sp. NBC_01389]|uniref:DUF222 domain-containing protein n=1 Tax=Microbispora sp. NBC_01389 TaxID=2903584 RepID=UPI0032504B0D